MTFTLGGFTTVKREGIELNSGFTATVNADLPVGSLEETITVSGATPVLDVQNVRTASVLTRQTLDTLPTNKTMQGFAALMVGATSWSSGGSSHDVGGNKADQFGTVIVHGSHAGDGRMLFDGMTFNYGGGGGSAKQYFINQADVQEMVLETAGMSAETEMAGIQFNAVPKSGGNRFSVYVNGAGTGGALQSDNLNDELRARGLQSASTIKKVWDLGAGVGGPIMKDKLWFYTAHRVWGDQEYAAGNYYNATQGTPFYTPDPSRQGYTNYYNRDHSARLTWQATAKHKFTVSDSIQKNCNCHLFVDIGDRAPEAAVDYTYFGIYMTQATWSYPATSRLLFQAGGTYLHNMTAPRLQPEVKPTDIAIIELSRNFTYNATASGLGAAGTGERIDYGQHNERFSLSYVTGSHAFKTGMFTMHGQQNFGTTFVNQALYYTFNSPTGIPTPVSVTQWASPHHEEETLKLNLGLYAQDQWTIKRLTLNLGVRYDHVNAYVPAQHRPAGRFVPAFDFAKVENAPNFHDINPRIGAAYDVFGNGRTAIKGSIGRFVNSVGAAYAARVNPANSIVLSTNRTWNDSSFGAGDPRSGNYVPDCDLNNFGANGECGAIDNNRFGTLNPTIRHADDVLTGWGNRGYTWLASAEVQHELRPGMAVGVGYHRRWFGNFLVTDNLAVTPADFDTFCITAPTDPRLPGGGGNQVCDLSDVTPSKFGLVDNLVTLDRNYGGQSEIYNGIDLTFNARFAEGGLLTGGVNFGRTETHCVQVDAPIQYCDNVPPFFHPQYKASGAYPLPWLGLQVSATYQGLAGTPIGSNFYSPTSAQLFPANYTLPNAAIAPALGRDLAACGSRVPCTATKTVQIVEPNKFFDKRLHQLDMRLTKSVRVSGMRVLGTFDVYNIFNGSTPTVIVATYGPNFMRPSAIQGGRVIKFGGQFEF